MIRQDRRRADRINRKSADLGSLNERHHEIINLHAMGLKNNKIAELMNVSERTVEHTVSSTLGQTKAAMIRGARDAETVDI